MSLKNTEIADKKNPKPIQKINNIKKQYGSNKWWIFNPVPVNNITAYKGINVIKKLIPENKHFDKGNIYLGIYTLFIKVK